MIFFAPGISLTKKIGIMKLPEEPMMLYSFINMKLRDFYPSLDALCEDMNVEREEIIRKLKPWGLNIILGGIGFGNILILIKKQGLCLS